MYSRLALPALMLSMSLAAGCAAGPESGATASNDPSRLVCRNEPNTGSRLPKRVCKTAAEWDQIAAEAQEAKRNMNRPAVGGNPPSESGRAR